MRFRLRHPEGQTTIDLSDSASIKDLRHEIYQASGIETFDLKLGYPPRPLDLDDFDDAVAISEIDLKLSGEQLILAKRDILPTLRDASQREQRQSTGIASSRNFEEAAQSSLRSGIASRSLPSNVEESSDSPEISVPGRDGTLVLRVMPDDNSCLFRSLSYVMLGPGIDSMHELRSLVASTINSNPEMYSDAILGKPREEYCRWIQTEASWGGYIELSILAKHFGTEIASINVQDGRVDRFNENASRRCILVYSGIHYDAIALSPYDRLGFGRKAEPEDDTKVFDSSDDIILTSALDLCETLRKQHYYTDTATFVVCCNICGWTGSGEKGATEHATQTGHMSFGES